MPAWEFVLRGVHFPVKELNLRQSCGAFAHGPQMEQIPLTSNLTPDIVRLFIFAVEREAIELTSQEVEGRAALSDGFTVEAFLILSVHSKIRPYFGLCSFGTPRLLYCRLT
jgi:hypothetical protein